MAQLAALLKPRTALAALAKEFAQSASPTSGITAYGNTGEKKKRKKGKVRLRPGTSLLHLVKYREDQERDDHGRFADEGGGATAAADDGGPTLGALFSDSLGISRGDMPQIPNDHKPKFAAELKERGVTMKPETVSASSLKPTQKDFNPENVAFLRGEIAAGRYKDNPIVVSREGRVLDGHHRWAVEAQRGGKMDVLRVDLPIRDLLREAASFNTRHGITARTVTDKVTRAKLGKLLKFDPDQPRDEAGRWTDSGGGAETSADDAVHGLGTEAIETPATNLLQPLTAEHLRQLGPVSANKLNELYGKAAEAKPEFDRTLQQIADETNAVAQLPPLKGANRATEKIMADYGGDASRMKDLLRGTLEVDSVAGAQAALARVQGTFNVEKGGFRNLLDPAVDPVDGYRDIKLNVRMKNGTVAEVQFNVPAMLAVKERMHVPYEERRKIEGRLLSENRDATPAERLRIDTLNATMKAAYEPVWKAISGGP